MSDARTAILLAGTICGLLLLTAIFWVGLLGSDDSLYWAGSSGWLAHVPYLGTTHWALRQTLVIPIAIARVILGDDPLALVLPSLLYTIGALVVAALWIRRIDGVTSAVAAMALIATNPQIVLLSSIANIDLVEIFFVLSGFALLHRAMAPQVTPRSRRVGLLLSGLALGLAMLSRETTAFAVVAIGLLFLAGYGMRRANYFIIGIGFAAVVGLEFLYVWWMSGDLLYRANISLHHDATTNRLLDQGAAVPLLHPAIDPLTMLLFNHNFGLLTWIGVPLTIWLLWRGKLAEPARRFAVLAITLALTWTAICAEAWSALELLPRYYLLPAVLLSMLTGMALSRLWRDGRRRLAALLGLLLIAANLLSIAVDYRNSVMYGEHMLAGIAAREPGIIHTDTQTLNRARLMLLLKGVAGHVTDQSVAAGDLFLFDPLHNGQRPGSDWIVVERHGLPPTLGQTLASLLPAGMVSPALLRKLGPGHPDVTLYRLP